MSKLEEQIEEKLNKLGFPDNDDHPRKAQLEREIDWLKFQIIRRDSFRVAIVSASIGALMGGLVTLVGASIFQ